MSKHEGKTRAELIGELDAAREELDFADCLLDSMIETVFVFDPATKRAIRWNRAFRQVSGYSDEEIAAMKALDDWHDADDLRRAKDALELTTGGRVGVELGLLTKRGRTIPIEFMMRLLDPLGDRPTYVLSIGRDVSKRKRAEAALRESEARYRGLFENAPAMIHSIDQSGRIISVSEHWLDKLGYERDEVIGRKSTDFLSPASQRYAKEEVLPNYFKTGVCTDVAYEFVTKSGAILDVLLSAISELDAEGNIVRSFAALTDMTERKRAEEERLRLESQFHRAQKLESLGVLASGIAHDFNNLLVPIYGNMDLALLEFDESSPVREYIADARMAARRAAELIDQMLAYAGMGKASLACVDLSKIVREIADLLRASVPKKTTLRFELAPELPAAQVDPTQVRQIVMNLITNAAQAIGERGGEIVLQTEEIECDAAFLDEGRFGQTLAEGTYIRLRISDTGPGMDAETQARIFDPFFTTKSSGSGLGLSAVHGIVRSHEGAIAVDSERGRGTTFTILLPVAPEQAVTAEVDTVASEWRGTGTVLVVDDEDQVRTLAARFLDQLGFAVRMARDGVEAVELFEADPDSITCVLLDSNMPRMGGSETLAKLRQIRSEVPVLLTSGVREEALTRRLANEGELTRFIHKPYDLAGLRDELCGLLDRRPG